MYVLLFFIGACFGSFAYVIGERLPKKIPFLLNRSYCPNCKQTLQVMDLIPILSYLFLAGKCRYCKQKIPLFYLLIEIIMGCLFLYSYKEMYPLFPSFLFTAFFLFILIIIYITDRLYMLIPNVLLWFSLPLCIYYIFELSPYTKVEALLGAIVGYSLIRLLIFISKGKMGEGDMKLFALVGSIVAWPNILVVFVLAVFIGTVYALFYMTVYKLGLQAKIPFAPAIVIASVITYFHGDYLFYRYMLLLQHGVM